MKKYFFFLIFLFLFFSCSKDEFVPNDSEFKNEYLDLRGGGSLHIPGDHPDTLIQTILGGVLDNPFEISNLQNALKELCGDTSTSRIQITATHKLIKFSPRDLMDVRTLFRDMSLVVHDYPLNREVLKMGDYYGMPNSSGDMPDLYSTVEVNQVLPTGIPYSIVEEYAYIDDEPLLIIESFRLTRNFDYVNEYIYPEDIAVDPGDDICGIIIPPVIDCDPGYIPELVIDDTQVGPGGRPVYKWICVIDPNYGNGTSYPDNSCGCPVYSDPRKPGGCIDVESNLIPGEDREGVNNVRIVVRDYRFGFDHVTFTDEDGCWKMNHRFKGKIWVWVWFMNEDSYERYFDHNWANPLDYIGMGYKFVQPTIDYVNFFEVPDIQECNEMYWRNAADGNGTRAHIYWGAASVNNEIQNYIEFASDLGDLPIFLDIYLPTDRQDGVAIMGHRWNIHNVITGFPDDALIPDMTIGINQVFRTALDRLAYHEIGHALHFEQVGHSWWAILIAQEFDNILQVGGDWNGWRMLFDGNPNGTGNEPFAGYVAMAESWANHSSFASRGVVPEARIFEDGFVPEGLYNDLIDDTPWENIFVNGISFDDHISGYTLPELFISLNSNVNSLDSYELELLGLMPAGNTLADFTELFNAYTP